MRSALDKYVPEESIPLIAEWLEKNRLHLRISKARRTKLGDFRPSSGPQPHQISVNGDLNRFHFLITLTHEVAHAVTWNKHKHKVKPHGPEWKNDFSLLLTALLNQVHFPEALRTEIQIHLQNPKASSCSDPRLYKALKKYDPSSDKQLLEEIEPGALFMLDAKRKFKKGAKRRTRFDCIEIGSGRRYYIHAHAEVIAIENKPVNYTNI